MGHGYALQLYRKFKLPDEDDSWIYGETGSAPNPGASSPSTAQGADVLVTGALARLTEVHPLNENPRADRYFTINFYGNSCAKSQGPISPKVVLTQ